MEQREPVFVWHYCLQSKGGLNAKSRRTAHRGALLRVGNGFGCLHPWPDLGDPPLEVLLDALAQGECRSGLVRQALAMAAEDGAARRAGISLLSGQEALRSHATISSLEDGEVEAARERGFGMVKLKGSTRIEPLAAQLNCWSSRWPDLRWRIDFNGVLGEEGVCQFVAQLDEPTRSRIDFLEDPCPYSAEGWERLRSVHGMALARDEGAEPSSKSDVLVLKPARVEVEAFASASQRLVVTSNMDHPLGQCYAAAKALQLRAVTNRAECDGLQTHELFDWNEFSERLGPAGPGFHASLGPGLGFGDLLEGLPWKRVK